MYTIRELLAVALAALLGAALLLKPTAVLRLQWFMFDASTTGKDGRWGGAGEGEEDDDGSLDLKSWHRWAARAVGAVVIGVGIVILAMPHL